MADKFENNSANHVLFYGRNLNLKMCVNWSVKNVMIDPSERFALKSLNFN